MVTPDQGYLPTPESVARHTAPKWWQDAKFGILVTWGPYAVPAFALPTDSFFAFSEWYWLYQQLEPGELEGAFPEAKSAPNTDSLHREHHRERYGEDVTYDDLLDRWRAEAWDPDAWIRLFEESGAKYFVLVAKHHDGVALWPTATSGRHTGELGPRRDIVGELMEAAEGSPLRTGLFYAMAEWFTPAPRPEVVADADDPLFDLAFNRKRLPRNAYSGADVPYRGYRPVADYARDHVIPQLRELTERYRPSILWFDLPGDAGYYDANRVIADFYNTSAGARPDGVAVNDRAAIGAHGDFHTYEYGHHASAATGSSPFEACRSIGTSFGYNDADTEQYADADELIETLIEVVSQGGNLLLNVGPRADGSIDPRQVDRLRRIGRWLDINGEAVYGSRAWSVQSAGPLRFTVGAEGTLYGFVTPRHLPGLIARVPALLDPAAPIEILGVDEELVRVESHWTTLISLPDRLLDPRFAGTPIVLRLGPAALLEPVAGESR